LTERQGRDVLRSLLPLERVARYGEDGAWVVSKEFRRVLGIRNCELLSGSSTDMFAAGCACRADFPVSRRRLRSKRPERAS
jgi:hypothetical protein